jgi:hypothetical protein
MVPLRRTREAQAAPTKAPQQKSWVARHKTITAVIIGVGPFFGATLWALSFDD